jgi:hypothetical protein
VVRDLLLARFLHLDDCGARLRRPVDAHPLDVYPFGGKQRQQLAAAIVGAHAADNRRARIETRCRNRGVRPFPPAASR